MKCPKTAIISSFLYLERLESEGKLLLQDKKDIEKIVAIMERDLDEYVNNVQKYENSKKSLPFPDLPQFHIASKHSVSGTNFIQDGGNIKITDEQNFASAEINQDVVVTLNTYESDTVKPTKDAINNLSLKNEETFAYIGYSSVMVAEQILKQKFTSYLADYHDENSFDSNETDEVIDIINAMALRFYPNPHLSSAGINPQDNILELNEETIDQIKEEFLNSDKLAPIFKKELIDIDVMINTIKEQINYDFKNSLLNMPLNRSLSHQVFFENISRRFNVSANEEFMKPNRMADTTNLEIIYIPKTSSFEITYNKTVKKEVLNLLTSIRSKKEKFNESLDRREKIDITPLSIVANLKNAKPSVKISFDEKDVNYIKISSAQGSKLNYYHSNLTDGKIKQMVIDESDQNAGGNKGEVLRKIASNVDNIVVGTGTGITGTARSIVLQLANSGNIKNIPQMEQQYTELCGVFEIKSPFVSILLKLVTRNPEIAQHFHDSTYQAIELLKNNDLKNTALFFEKFTRYIIDKARSEEMEIDKIDIFSSANIVKNIFTTLSKDKDFAKQNFSSGLKLLQYAIFNNHSLSKEVAGIQAGMLASLVMSQKDSNISITTRELLTGKKENIQIIDHNNFINQKQDFKDNKIEEYLKKNIIAPKVIKEFLLKQAEIKYTTQVFNILKTNFDFFVKAFRERTPHSKANLKLLSEISQLSTQDFMYHTSASGSSTSNGIFDLYSAYLKNNKHLPKELTNKLSKESLVAFNTCIQVFQKKILEENLLEQPSIQKGNPLLDNAHYEMTTFNPSKLYNLFGETTELGKLVYFEDGYPYCKENQTPYIFSVDTILAKKEWKEFINSEGIDYQFSLVNFQGTEIIDNFTSIGKVDLLRTSMIENKENVVVASSRKVSSVVNLYDVISVLGKRNDKTKPFYILAVQTPELQAGANNINNSFLTKNNIHIKVLDSKQIAVEVKKATSKGEQYSIISNYEPISRGLSLADTHRTLLTNPVSKKSDGIQLMARAINPSANKLDSNLFFHNNGKDIEIKMKFSDYDKTVEVIKEISPLIEFNNGKLSLNDENSDLEDLGASLLLSDTACSINSTYTSLVNKTLKESNDVYKGFTSGEMADTAQSDLSKLVTITTPYKSILVESAKKGEIEIKEPQVEVS